MIYVPLLYMAAVLTYLTIWGMAFSRLSDTPVSRFFRAFLLNFALWAASDLLLFMPIARGWETEIYRVGALFWIPAGLWYLLFVYALFGKRPDPWLFLCGGITVVAAALYMFTDLGILGTVRHVHHAIDVRPGTFPAFAMVPVVTTVYAISILIRRGRRAEYASMRASFRVLVLGSIVAVMAIVAFNWFLRELYDFSSFPHLASCSASLVVFFVYDVIVRYEAMSFSMDKVAQRLFEDVHDGIVILDRHGKVRRMNRAAREMLMVERESGPEQRVERMLSPAGEGYSNPKEIRLEDGEEERILGLSRSLVSRQGVGVGEFVVVEDLTQQRLARSLLQRSNDELEELAAARAEELRQAQKMESIGTLAGGIAHDFNNLLSGIMGFATAARDETSEEEEVHEDAEEILLAAGQARDIVRQLLDFSRPGDDIEELFDLVRTVKDVLTLTGASEPLGSPVRLVADLPSAEIFVRGRPSQIHQVFMNLCRNAIQSLEGGEGVVEVSVQMEEEGADHSPAGASGGQVVVVSVRDSGTGMSQEVRERIFDPFFTTKRSGKGTGLGLATARRTIESHGGAIAVESEEGKGSVFTVFLLRANEAAQEEKLRGMDELGGDERILIVDDKEQIVRVSRRLLAPLGYHVTTGTSPREALELLREDPGRFDVVITDYMMPEMDGVTLAGEVKTLRPDLPIILISGNLPLEVKERAERGVVDAFLDKPLSKVQLAGAVRGLSRRDDPA